MAKERRDAAQEITNQFIAAIEGGMVDGKWERPWKVLCEFPTNILTGKPYRGMNALLLMFAGGGLWGTYKQWQEKGGQVRKGEKGMMIIRPLTGKDKDTGDSFIWGWGAATVFNYSQQDGFELPETGEVREFVDNVAAEKVLADSQADIRHGGDRAFYVPSQDFVQMPTKAQFDSETDYYATAMHELVHWTGHKSRLDRNLDTTRFGDDAYAFEELVAELGSCFLANLTGVHSGFQENHAKYLAGWLRILKGDKQAVIKAASLAQKATDLLCPPKAEEVKEDDNVEEAA